MNAKEFCLAHPVIATASLGVPLSIHGFCSEGGDDFCFISSRYWNTRWTKLKLYYTAEGIPYCNVKGKHLSINPSLITTFKRREEESVKKTK